LVTLALSLLALLTMVAGNLFALPQRNVKRMLAYSSIAHAGYLLLGVAALLAVPGGSEPLRLLGATALLGSATPSPQMAEIQQAILFYLVSYAVSAMGAFGAVSVLERKEDEDRGTAWDLERFAGLAQRRPALAMAMAAFMLSLAGMPPTLGFIGKLLVFKGAVSAGLIGLAVVGILASAAGAFYYLRVVVYMFMRPLPETVTPIAERKDAAWAVGLCLAAVLGLGLIPGPLVHWMAQNSGLWRAGPALVGSAQPD
jgi:NADH-quinone oxidoreductase subunit N